MNDTQKAIETLEAMRDRTYGSTEGYDALTLAIDALRKVGEWIPVSERLPETSEWYLVTVNDEINLNGQSVEHKFFQDCIGQWNCNEEIERVTAWMPLPEPYKEQSNGE